MLGMLKNSTLQELKEFFFFFFFLSTGPILGIREPTPLAPMLLYGENGKTMDFFRNYCSLWYKSW